MGNLGGRVVDLYNAFNKGDGETELFAEVRLPLVGEKRLRVSFQSDPETFHDALHVLSEGHIRCLGLAILLAKNLETNAPFVIFDDPVNAIDEDHRRNIRMALFVDSFFSDKQIILTSHGHELVKDIENDIGGRQASKIKKYAFTWRDGGTDIVLSPGANPLNYIIKARGMYSDGNMAGALAECRRALEAMAFGRLWTRIRKAGVKMRLEIIGPNAPIGLYNLVNQLKRGLGELPPDDTTTKLIQALEWLLNQESWGYLNQGTHEQSDRCEFDRGLVGQIIGKLEELDDVLTPKKSKQKK